MLRMEWNALRVGDQVLVHDDDDLAAPLTEGTIRILQSRPSGWNDLAIRLTGSTGPVIRPRGGACHLLPCARRVAGGAMRSPKPNSQGAA